ncbi:crosslink repair DNA glycosylase YcaQ family protein [Stenotrophomonas rhizophila]|uniref:DNA glycosylase AlkZ-like family protein n=1 Tax=Stenotrophomonas rhizophila TaxID=216778 RepID=UPI0035147383
MQIDTLSVMERAHHHGLWNRVPDYDPVHLNRLVGERQLVQYRYHAAACLPMRDYRHALRRMQAIRTGETHAPWTGWRCGSGCLPADGLKRRQPGVGRRRLVHPAPSLSEAQFQVSPAAHHLIGHMSLGETLYMFGARHRLGPGPDDGWTDIYRISVQTCEGDTVGEIPGPQGYAQPRDPR